MKYELRPYQQRVLDDLWSWFTANPDGDPIVEAAVGAGKSLMIAALAQRADREFPGTRVLVLTHQKELLAQNLEKMRSVWPEASVGVYSASFGAKQLGRQVTYATIGSIYQDAKRLGRIDIVLADECHLINPRQVGIWRRFINELREHNPAMRVIGWTGTPFRGNGVWLTALKDSLFEGIAARVPMSELLADGFLSPLVPAPTATKLDTSNVATSGDDYVVSDLASAVDRPELVRDAVAEIIRLAESRKRWLVFCVTIEHAEHVMAELRSRGVATDMVSAKTPQATRDALISHFRRGVLRCLCNVGVLTTGFDVPEIDFIALLRPTRSPVLYVQIAGRGMRLAPGKTDCLWADFSDTTERMGPVDRVTGRLPSARGSGEAPFKLCESCGGRNATAASVCKHCGAPFELPKRTMHGTEASEAEVISATAVAQPKVTRYEIDSVDYRIHVKLGSQPSMRVEYNSGMLTVAREWVALSHEGYALVKAMRWWETRSLIDSVPPSTEEAIKWIEWGQQNGQPVLRQPTALLVKESGKYPEIVMYEWDNQQTATR